MNMMKWKHTNLHVSPLVFGALRFLGPKDNPEDPERVRNAEELVETCLASGINFFDHADLYGHGNCEKIFGAVLRHHPDWREKMVIQTKCGIRVDGLHRYDQSPEHMIKTVEGSLQRLGVEQLDVLLVHRPDPLLDPASVASVFEKLRSEGKVRYFGVSNFSVAQMRLLQSACDEPLVANQIQLSLLHPWAISEGVFVNRTESVFCGAEGVVNHCRLKGIQVQAWSPVAAGHLSKESDTDDARTKAVREAVAKVADESGLSREAVALAWILRHPGGIVPIIGTMKPERVLESIRALDLQMDSDTWWRLFNAALGRRLP